MAYVTPSTRTTGTVITAPIWNQDVVDNVIASQRPLVHVQDQKASGTHGGTFTQGAWRTRDLNTEVTDTDSLASVGSNQITLAAGTYYCEASAEAWNTGGHQVRVQDTTGAATLITGLTKDATGTRALNQSGTVAGRFTIAVQSVLELQHYCQTTAATAGYGVAHSFTTEIYADVRLWRIGA